MTEEEHQLDNSANLPKSTEMDRYTRLMEEIAELELWMKEYPEGVATYQVTLDRLTREAESIKPESASKFDQGDDSANASRDHADIAS